MTQDKITQNSHRRNQWSFEEAKRMFAGSGRIWDLADLSETGNAEQQVQAICDRIVRHKRSFWVYEQDMTPIGSAVTRIAVSSTLTGTGLVTQGKFDPVSFSLHSLRRYWERNEEGHQLDDFKTIEIAHLTANIKITDQGLFNYRLDHLVPYGQGAFVGTAVNKHQIFYTAQNNRVSITGGHMLGFNAVTYLNCTQMNAFQKRQWQAAQTDPVLYQRLHDSNIKARTRTAQVHIVKVDSMAGF